MERTANAKAIKQKYKTRVTRRWRKTMKIKLEYVHCELCHKHDERASIHDIRARKQNKKLKDGVQ
jgi:hypothetical protein